MVNRVVGLFVLISVGLCTGQDIPTPVISVKQGQVQGTIKATPEGYEFYAFQGIPYGKAPIGQLRFQAYVPKKTPIGQLRLKAPEAPDPWDGVLQVTEDSPPCIQLTFNPDNPTVGSEDCLQLNVYTPQLPLNNSIPSKSVHVFIHGGAFVEGNINFDDVNPGRYIDADIVLVAMKYRLGPIGFLSTDDKAASGNWGLLDQNLALNWVQDNIGAFGGNPDDVTLSGQSAGSASVIMQYQSLMSAGLFHRAIAESGSSLCPWAVQENPLYYANKMGEYFNCSTDNTTVLIDCLRSLPAEDIVAHSLDMMLANLTYCFVPNVETSSSGVFLTEDPLSAFGAGHFNKVPLQLGFNKDEGTLIFEFVYFLFEDINNVTFDVIIPAVLYVLTDYRSNLLNVSYAVKDEYYAGVDLTNQIDVNIATINFMSDVFMKSWVAKTAMLVSSHGVPVYLYAFNHVSNSSSSNYTGEPDVNHGDELKYLWWRNITNANDAEFETRFFPLWSQFILKGDHGSPAVDDDPWLATPPGQYHYLNIVDNIVMEGNYDQQKMDFWWYTVTAIVNG